MDTVQRSIAGMTCGHCAASVRQALADVPGVQVQDVRIGATSGTPAQLTPFLSRAARRTELRP